MFSHRGRRDERRVTIERLYGAIVAQARLPVFYTTFEVPDTVEGRFDLIVLHVHLLFRRLSREDETMRASGQELFDYFFDDMDASLRELGVSDLTVPRKMRAFGEAFYGRAGAYDAALAEPDDTALTAALHRNIHGGKACTEAAVRRLARYVRRADAVLAAADVKFLCRGELVFARPEEAAGDG